MNGKLFKDFCTFSKYQLKSRDIDPTYPILRAVYKARRLGVEDALWYTCLFVTFYNIASAEIAFKRFPRVQSIGGLRLPTGTERRGFRGNDHASEHILDLVSKAPLRGWVESLIGISDSQEVRWRNVRDEYQKFKFCGPWASYKFADLMKWVHKFDITADDLGVGGGSATAGPIPGLVKLTGRDWKDCAFNMELHHQVLQECMESGVDFNGLDQLETCLCDFNSMLCGRYYPGKDIDEQQDFLTKSTVDMSVFWQCRIEAFDHRFLGELGGWSGVRKDLRGYYVSHQEVYNPWL